MHSVKKEKLYCSYNVVATFVYPAAHSYMSESSKEMVSESFIVAINRTYFLIYLLPVNCMCSPIYFNTTCTLFSICTPQNIIFAYCMSTSLSLSLFLSSNTQHTESMRLWSPREGIIHPAQQKTIGGNVSEPLAEFLLYALWYSFLHKNKYPINIYHIWTISSAQENQIEE